MCVLNHGRCLRNSYDVESAREIHILSLQSTRKYSEFPLCLHSTLYAEQRRQILFMCQFPAKRTRLNI